MNLNAWVFFGRFYKGSAIKIWLTLVLSFAQAGATIAVLLLIRYTFNQAIVSRDMLSFSLVGTGIILIYFLNAGIMFLGRNLSFEITKNATLRLRDEILKKFYSLSHAYNNEADRSRIHAVVVEDTQRLDRMSDSIAKFLPAFLLSLALVGMLLYLNWILFLAVMIVVPLVIWANRIYTNRIKQEVRKFHRSFEKFSKGMHFVLQAMDLTRIQAAEDQEIAKQSHNIQQIGLLNERVSLLKSGYAIVQNTLISCISIVILMLGGMAVANDSMTIGGLFSFYSAIAFLKNYLSIIFLNLPSIIEGNESLNTLYEWLRTSEEKPYTGTRQVAFTGRIRLEEVSFGYGDKLILENLDLGIGSGETIAVIGPNGSGKSTVANLILGFYRPQKGRIYADDIAFEGLDIDNLRRYIGVVRQNPIIFSGTVLENISYGSPDINMEAVVKAAELATAHEFIQRLPIGYDTFVGESGFKLSGGERQRIAIARALLRQPKLLILDEPTNHLDQASVHQLIENLNALESNPAILIISHDMKIVKEAEQVYVLQDGRLMTQDKNIIPEVPLPRT